MHGALLGKDIGPQGIVHLGQLEPPLDFIRQVGRLQNHRPPQVATRVGPKPSPKRESEQRAVGAIALAAEFFDESVFSRDRQVRAALTRFARNSHAILMRRSTSPNTGRV